MSTLRRVSNDTRGVREKEDLASLAGLLGPEDVGAFTGEVAKSMLLPRRLEGLEVDPCAVDDGGDDRPWSVLVLLKLDWEMGWPSTPTTRELDPEAALTEVRGDKL